jgi:hypothetical protein
MVKHRPIGVEREIGDECADRVEIDARQLGPVFSVVEDERDEPPA